MCGRNEGHLIRIVGPAFEMVCGWAQQGVPLKVAFRGIDRFCERYSAKGPRRRPVRIEFCEADILDAFDDWCRAVGVTAAAGGDTGEPAPRRPALSSHIDRVIARLSALRGNRSRAFDERIAATVAELDALAPQSRRARGDARAAIVERLAALDGALIRTAISELDERTHADLRAEAVRELATFGARMTPEARTRAVDAAFERLAREALSLPVLRYD